MNSACFTTVLEKKANFNNFYGFEVKYNLQDTINAKKPREKVFPSDGGLAYDLLQYISFHLAISIAVIEL